MSQERFVGPEASFDGAADLLEDYRRRRVALQHEARELAKLQAHVLEAAERDAAAIIAGTRDRIGRLLGEARRDLQHLSMRVEGIAGIDSDGDCGGLLDPASVRDAAASRQSLQQVRRDVAHVLDDARPELEQLQAQTSRLFANVAAAAPAVLQSVVEPVERHASDHPPSDEFEARIEPLERPLLSRLPSVFGAMLQRDSIRVWLIAFGIAACATLLGAVGVMRQGAPAPTSPPPDSRLQRPQRSSENDAGGTSSATTAPVLPQRASGDSSAPPGVRGSQPANEAPTVPQPTATSGAGAGTKPKLELTTASQRWLDAYGRQDVATMRLIATPDARISDHRADDERLPFAAENVRRSLQNVSLQFIGDTSILTARMLEQVRAGGQNDQRISRVSLIWIRESGQWQVSDVEILGDRRE